MSTYTTTWKSPSNIALVKYWGKKTNEVQIPSNASISFTLRNCATITTLEFEEMDGLAIKVRLEGDEEPSFEPKIEQFLHRIANIFPFVLHGKYLIDTSNSFPHSSGIASSASGMSALALCICDIAVEKGLLTQDKFKETASELARLGSGSASRSIYGPMGVWGDHPDFIGSSDSFAIPYSDVNAVFKDYCDTILLVHKGQKTVSSSIGHGLIDDNPYSPARFAQAQENMTKLKSILKSGNIDGFINLVESEALTLHSLMMSSNPYFILMKPNTLKIIEAIWAKREEDGARAKWCFTLDAGANVHFLYPQADKAAAQAFIEEELAQYCENRAYIHDEVGMGAERV
ncbi:diphosphomevalonate decarboxylase [Bacteroidia bacterium]|nr:diphosphomevalonate decarboxylase [Bacteroidia bacterium]MDB9881750.1 diphosphomevalonate decarboxylase [Bacteroidia bacterium]